VNVLLVPAHPGFPGQIPQSRKTVVVVFQTWDVTETTQADVHQPKSENKHVKLNSGLIAWY